LTEVVRPTVRRIRYPVKYGDTSMRFPRIRRIVSAYRLAKLELSILFWVSLLAAASVARAQYDPYDMEGEYGPTRTVTFFQACMSRWTRRQ